ncbi:MAG: TIGR03086 family protein [Actinomycetota bacterium]|nr:TIGR03086 family protein [Actinomycetota bacterium]
MAFPDDPAERYAAISGGFTALVNGTTDWDAPSPVEGWAACDVVWHLVDWVPGLLSVGASIQLPTRDPKENDPVGDWARFDDGLRDILMKPETQGAQFAHPQAGVMPLGTAIDMMITPDVFMHSWDLAQATDQPIELDADFCANLLAGMEGIDEMLRSSVQYGPSVKVSDDADVQTRLVAFVGRNPNWRTRTAS